MITLVRVAVALLAVLVATGCAGTDQTPPAVDETQATERVEGFSFDSAPPDLLARCQRTARSVGYAVPCPTRLPAGSLLTGAVGPTGCVIEILGPGGVGGCAKSWRGWVVGSSEAGDQHLVITASPRPLANYAKVVNGPAWYPAARVQPLAWRTINGWRMRAVYAPQATNDGSAFANHVVLIWTVGQHTYGVGFHKDQGIPQTLRLNEALARGIKLVDP